MASPVIENRSESNETTDTTTHDISRPTGVSGRLSIVIFCFDGGSNVVVTPASGYTSFDRQNNGTAYGAEFFYRQEDGTEGTSVQFTTDDSEKSVHFVYQLSGAENPATQAPEIVSPLSAATADPDPSNITPTGGTKDYTFIVGGCANGEQLDDDTFINTASSGYGNLIQKTSGTGGTATTNIMCGSFDRTATVSSEDPGTFNADQSVSWILWTIAVHPQGSQTVTPGLISQTAAVFSPTINPGSVTVTPGLISQVAAVFAPTIAEGAASQGVTAGLISQLAATFSPTITPGAVTVSPSLIGVAASVFAPDIEAGDAPPPLGGGLATIIRQSRRR